VPFRGRFHRDGARCGHVHQMRFTRFPRKIATLFPELVESRLAAMQEHRTTWWQQHRNHVAASWRESRASLRSLPPGPRAGILSYWQTCSLPGQPSLPPWYAARSQSQKALFLARPGRIAPAQIDFQRPTFITLGDVHDPRLPFHATCRTFLGKGMNSSRNRNANAFNN
jgi:hypothetical protein